MNKVLLALSLAASGAACAQSAPTPPASRPPFAGDPAFRDDARVMTRAQAAAEADARFARLDSDHDGVVTPDERRGAFGPGGRRPSFGDGGTDGPPPPPVAGKGGRPLTAAMFRERALRRFDRADANHDGTVDQAERRALREEMRARRDRMNGDTPPPPPGSED